jgi:transposase-like protein
MEEEIRQEAISRHCNGEKRLSIYRELNHSKVWFFKWLKRYQSGDPAWAKDKSTAPKRRPTQISEIDIQRIISVRQHLASQKFAQTGASAIK